jgi:hypothetical protein
MLSINHYRDSEKYQNETNFLERKDMFTIDDNKQNLIKFKNDYSSFNKNN